MTLHTDDTRGQTVKKINVTRSLSTVQISENSKTVGSSSSITGRSEKVEILTIGSQMIN